MLVGLFGNRKPATVLRSVAQPHSNNYLVLAAFQGMLDGITYALTSGRTSAELERNFLKPGNRASLETERAYRSERMF